jgi:hypothetical protein
MPGPLHAGRAFAFKENFMMQNVYNVTLSWGSREEGNYSNIVLADGEESAVRVLAEEMADQDDSPTFDSDAEREEWIQDRVDNGFRDVYKVVDQFAQDLESLFPKQLFPDGISRSINLDALGEVLAENRERLFGGRAAK